MVTLTVPVSSAVISSDSIPLARITVTTTITTDTPMTIRRCPSNFPMIFRYRFCMCTTGRFMGARSVSFGLYIR